MGSGVGVGVCAYAVGTDVGDFTKLLISLEVFRGDDAVQGKERKSGSLEGIVEQASNGIANGIDGNIG